MDRVLVTGGSGFIGTNLVDYLLDKGLAVLSVDVKQPQNGAHSRVFRNVDVRDRKALTRVVDEFLPTHVVHLAARTDFGGTSLGDYDVNHVGVQTLIDVLANQESVQRCIFASTRLVCRNGYAPAGVEDYNPNTAYGQSKVEAEKIIRHCRSMGWDWVIVRPTSIWGPWFDVPYRAFFLAVARGRYFHLGKANPKKSYGYVGNTVFQIGRLLESPRESVRGKTFYLSDYEAYTIREWANTISMQLRGRNARTVLETVMRLAAWAGDCLQNVGCRNPPMTSFRLTNMRADTTIGVFMAPTEELCGSLPYCMEDGVARTIDWLREQRFIV